MDFIPTVNTAQEQGAELGGQELYYGFRQTNDEYVVSQVWFLQRLLYLQKDMGRQSQFRAGKC